ncbi:MAG TPA: bifunctional diaminohydroxyphosphoribosylaminopyrimidine deaminase/5-amino-6-(5-phosphoribosylamino)uracil reductase RibD [Candidatus Binatia bacterium]|nr:bifunctional diaminohydroxyphosphoribosylaminopyrimidine deaminase/5-amino-6-(5-phosphoribosylamino)uracil reductase RibD [Candidatus Binatia bacterium]
MAESRRGDRDRYYLRMACRLARKAAGRTSPNPMVGAVLVRAGKIVGAGYHRAAGGDHAEIIALKRAGAAAKGATLYITLEPCSHHGRTPPCADALIDAGIKEVIAGMRDPNPLVAGRGFRKMRRAGIKVEVGLCAAECQLLLEAFAKFIRKRIPFVTLKLAATLDGKIAAASGDSKWISNPESRALVHRWRNETDAVLVGAGTVRADDPELTCRAPGGRNPYRVVLDSRLTTPLSARLLRHPDAQKTIMATTARASAAKARAIRARGAQVWRLPARHDQVAWLPLLKRLAKIGIVSVMIEGGAAVAASAVKHRVVDKIVFFYAPKLVGGDGRAMIDSLAIGKMARAISLRVLDIRRSGSDILVTGCL